MIVKPELIITKDGSHTLYVQELDEHYHSLFGAVTESRHVFIDAGLKAVANTQINILEIGFGTGLNAFLSLLEVRGTGKTLVYTGLEKYPLEPEILGSLNYASMFPGPEGDFFQMLHESPWNTETVINEEFILNKICGDICSFNIQDQFHLVYFDAFAPDKQPELWTTGIFTRIHRGMKHGSILTTYSSKGLVQRNLAQAGFLVEKLPGPPGKREIVRAKKK